MMLGNLSTVYLRSDGRTSVVQRGKRYRGVLDVFTGHVLPLATSIYVHRNRVQSI